VSAFLSKMFDVGGLPLLTFGNCDLLNYTYVFLKRFYVFFKIQKNMTFSFF